MSEQLFFCEHCTKEYKTERNLVKHIDSKHSELYAQPTIKEEEDPYVQIWEQNRIDAEAEVAALRLQWIEERKELAQRVRIRNAQSPPPNSPELLKELEAEARAFKYGKGSIR